MAISDYDGDATELLETYGAPYSVQFSLLKGTVELIRCGQTSS